jgi:hypothetical protein
MRNSPHKTWEIQIQSKKRKESGNERLGWLPYFGPITCIFMWPFNVVIGEDFWQSILDSSMYRWLFGQGKPRHEVWTRHGWCLSRHRVYRGTWETKDSDVNNKSSQTRTIWVNTLFVLFWRISGMVLEERHGFRILPSFLIIFIISPLILHGIQFCWHFKIVVFLEGICFHPIAY